MGLKPALSRTRLIPSVFSFSSDCISNTSAKRISTRSWILFSCKFSEPCAQPSVPYIRFSKHTEYVSPFLAATGSHFLERYPVSWINSPPPPNAHPCSVQAAQSEMEASRRLSLGSELFQSLTRFGAAGPAPQPCPKGKDSATPAMPRTPKCRAKLFA